MRKITARIKRAFDYRERDSLDNTVTDGHNVWLYGTKIIKRVCTEQGEPMHTMFTLAGWNTPTTRERLSGILGLKITTKKGQAYCNGQPIDSNQWYCVEEMLYGKLAA